MISYDFKGQTAVVTGGTRGIGAAISMALLKAGAKVVAVYGGNREAAEAFAAKTARFGRKTSVLPQALTHGEINHQLGLPGAYTDAVDGFITARLEDASR